MSTDDMADDIERMRVYLDLESFDLIGHSAAGQAAIEYAERYDGHLAHLILVDASTYGDGADDRAESEQAKANFKRLAKDPRYSDAVRHLMSDPFPPPSDEAMMQGLRDTGALDFADPISAAPRFAKTTEGMIPSSFAWRTSSAADRAKPLEQEQKLGLIRAHALIVQGAEDWLVPEITAEHIHKGIVSSKLLVLQDSGHFPWIEKPILFFDSVNEFLGSSA